MSVCLNVKSFLIICNPFNPWNAVRLIDYKILKKKFITITKGYQNGITKVKLYIFFFLISNMGIAWEIIFFISVLWILYLSENCISRIFQFGNHSVYNLKKKHQKEIAIVWISRNFFSFQNRNRLRIQAVLEKFPIYFIHSYLY